MIKKLVFFIMMILLVGCYGRIPPDPEIIEIVIIETVEVIKIVEVEKDEGCSEQLEAYEKIFKEYGLQSPVKRTIPGLYLVPEEMRPGRWSYETTPKVKLYGGTCWITTYSDSSAMVDSMLDRFHSGNSGTFRLYENVRIVEITECVYLRIGE